MGRVGLYGVLLSSVVMLCSSGAYADESAKIRELEERIARLEELLAETKQDVKKVAQPLGEENKKPLQKIQSVAVLSEDESKLAYVMLNPGPYIKRYDDKYSFKLTGRLMLDTAFYNDDAYDYADGTVLRRLWVGIEGTVGKDWYWRAEPDFANDEVVLRDAYIRYQGVDGVTLTAGHQLEPFGMSSLTSSKYLTFVERSLTYALQPSRRIGFEVDFTLSPEWMLHTGIYGGTTSSPSPRDDEGYSVSARTHFTPYYEGTNLVHVGLAASLREPNGDVVRYKSRPEANVDAHNIVDTGVLHRVDGMQLYGVELAGQWDSFHIQSEYNLLEVARETRQDLTFNSWYTSIGWFVTGEARSYSQKSGVFGRVHPKNEFSLDKGGVGAWEIAARYSSLDLNDEDVHGGEVNNVTLGVNWYPNSYVRFMLNYIQVDESSDHPSRVDDDPSIILIRSQVEF